MSGINVLVVTSNRTTREAVLKPWGGGSVYVYSSVTEAMQRLDDTDGGVVALDYKGKLENLEYALNDIHELSPSVALIVFCTKKQRSEIAESEISDKIVQLISKPLNATKCHSGFEAARTRQRERASLTPPNKAPLIQNPKENVSHLKHLLTLLIVAFTAWLVYKIMSPHERPATPTPPVETAQAIVYPSNDIAAEENSDEQPEYQTPNLSPPGDLILTRIDAALDTLPDEELLDSDAYRLMLTTVEAGSLTPEYSERLDILAQRLQRWGEILIQNEQQADLQRLAVALRAIPSLANMADTLEQAAPPQNAPASGDTPPNNLARIAVTRPAVVTPAPTDNVTPAIKVSGRNPGYPRNAERRGIEGYIDLEFTITETGEVTEVSVMQAEPQGVFEDTAIAAVTNWHYRPRLLNDQAVSEHKQIRLRFRL